VAKILRTHISLKLNVSAGSKAFAQISAREWLWLSVAAHVTVSTLTQFFTPARMGTRQKQAELF
jgi:hypothetical protein